MYHPRDAHTHMYLHIFCVYMIIYVYICVYMCTPGMIHNNLSVYWFCCSVGAQWLTLMEAPIVFTSGPQVRPGATTNQRRRGKSVLCPGTGFVREIGGLWVPITYELDEIIWVTVRWCWFIIAIVSRSWNMVIESGQTWSVFHLKSHKQNWVSVAYGSRSSSFDWCDGK